MSAEITDVSAGIITFKISGTLQQTELAEAQKMAAEVIRKQGKVRFLVLVENFAGVAKTGNWGDISFSTANDPFIEKMAIVGDKKWEDVALLFTSKGIRRVLIEYFSPADLARAQAWLTTDH